MNRWIKLLTGISLLLLSVGCQKSSSTFLAPMGMPTTLTQTASPPVLVKYPPRSTLTQQLAISPLPDEARLVDIRSVNNKIILDIRYATTNNFLKRKVYPVGRCVLRGVAARALSKVQDDLATQGLGLKVFDCYRPRSVQKQMWAILPDDRYVANPVNGSRHNRGAAVDLTLVDRNGKELEMPTGFDDFSERAYRNYMGGTAQSRKNRQLLEEKMKKYGLIPLATEWWHFDAPGWDKFSVLDIPFGAIP